MYIYIYKYIYICVCVYRVTYFKFCDKMKNRFFKKSFKIASPYVVLTKTLTTKKAEINFFDVMFDLIFFVYCKQN